MNSQRYPGEAFAPTESFPSPVDERESSANGHAPDYVDEAGPHPSFDVAGYGPAGGFESQPSWSSLPPDDDGFSAPTLAGAAAPSVNDAPPPVIDGSGRPVFEQQISLSGLPSDYGDPTMDMGTAPGLVPPAGLGSHPVGMDPSSGMDGPAGMGMPGGMAPPSGAPRPPIPASSGPGMHGRRPPRARGPRRAKLQLRHVNPWTVLKFSCVLSVALFFVWLITIGLLYGILQAAGVIGNINDAVTTINGSNSKAPITPGLVFGGAAIIGVINMVLFIALSTVGSVVYNLCADLVGGVEVTLSERE